jgi:hypothetical protein
VVQTELSIKREVAAAVEQIAGANRYKSLLMTEVLQALNAGIDDILSRFNPVVDSPEKVFYRAGKVLESCFPSEAQLFKDALLQLGKKVGEASGLLFGGNVADVEKEKLLYAQRLPGSWK